MPPTTENTEEDDKNVVVTGAEKPVTEALDDTETVADGVAELQRKLDEAERARGAAERRADEAFRRVGQAETTAYGSQMAVINSALETLNANRETLKREYSAALAAGEFDKVADIQAQIADEAARKVEVERGKAALESQARSQTQTTGDPRVERYVQNLQPRAAAWIRAHPHYVTDAGLNDELMEKHYAARRAGHADGTDGYFTFMESNLLGGGAAPARAQEQEKEKDTGSGGESMSAAAQATQRRDVQPSPAAPSRGGGGRQVRLSAREAEAARISGLTDEEYAKNMERERRAGTIGKDRVH